MRPQAALGVRVAVVFLLLILGLPLLSYYQPEWSQLPVLGFPLSWLVLGVLFYPVTWALSSAFVKASERLEARQAEQVRQERSES